MALWPGLQPDPTHTEPMPSGPLGCPWVGCNILAGSKKKGPEYFFRQASRRLGDPSIWKFYFLGNPVAVVSNVELIQRINAMEFKTTEALGASFERQKTGQTTTRSKKKPVLFGKNNVMFERNEKQHSFLRRLVGSAMNPAAVKAAYPTMQEIANHAIETNLIEKVNRGHKVKMEDVSTDYTIDIVQNQLLGLKLSSEEVEIFREKLGIWLAGLYSVVAIIDIPRLVGRSAPFKAR